jgi:hypothetical protein
MLTFISKYHSCALLSEGAVKCWGFNVYSQVILDIILECCVEGCACEFVFSDIRAFVQLGDNTTTSRPLPVDAVVLGSGVASVALGEVIFCFMRFMPFVFMFE